MVDTPPAISEFLRSKRIAVAGVSRDGRQPANAIFRRLRDAGHEVVPINPRAAEVEGVRCYPDLASSPGPIDGLLFAAPPAAALALVREAAALGVSQVWFHRSFGEGSVSDDAVRECETRGLTAIIGGCPLMYCEPVDLFHRCARWWLGRRGRISASGHEVQS